ncbi:MAG: hypothetical protein IJS28_11920 [Synergistaceae bacterium]|nr:hypothetical protein [Synergistaceae bacterium]
MRRKFIALLVIFMVLAFSEDGFAYKINHYREGEGVRAEAYRRNIRLIPIAQAQVITANRVGSRSITFTDIVFDNEAGKYPDSTDFRPVYTLNCVSVGRGYSVKVDAVTGQVLSFRQVY